jgi:hypothetical protein
MKHFINKPSMTIARRWGFSALCFVVLACTATKPTVSNSGLYEILVKETDGGGNIQFYEILSTEQEVGMLSNDERLSRKVLPSEAKTSTFLVLNMGEKPSGGHSLDIESVVEIPERIIVTVKEIAPEPGSMTTMQITYPYTVVRINSKKPIEIR